MLETSLYPAALHVERELLAIAMENGEILNACLAAGLKEHDFSLSDHRKVFSAMCSIQASGGPVNSIVIADKLGDLLLVASLMEIGPVVVKSHAIYYVQILAKKRRLRVLARLGEWLLQETIKLDADPDQLAEIVRRKLMQRGANHGGERAVS